MLLQSKIHLNDCELAIIKVIAYYDVFNYPVTKKEIFEYANSELKMDDLEHSLICLIEQGFIKTDHHFYFTPRLDFKFIEARVDANRLAEEMLPLAKNYCSKISKFPFIRGVFISGGLSKNYFHQQSDIDYFIITTKNRLWLCRTIFILYYKLLSKKKKEFFCLNYFISEADLTIPDRNQFVATEIATLIPMVNHTLYLQFLDTNDWYKSFFPQMPMRSSRESIPHKKQAIKSAIEYLFSGFIGNRMDDFLLRITLKHWRKKFIHMKHEDFDLQIRSRKHVCKHHTKGYQNKVLEKWYANVESVILHNDSI
jgi:hypothetical protein